MYVDTTRLISRFLQGRLPTGIDRVEIEYLRRFGKDSRALIRYLGKWVFVPHRDSQILFELLIQHDTHRVGLIYRIISCAFLLPFQKAPQQGAWLFNISHSGLEQDRYRQKVLAYGLKPIFFVHDLIPISHPEYSRPEQEKLHRKRMETVFSCAEAVIVNSEDTRKKLEAYALGQTYIMPKTAVARLASAPLPIPIRAPAKEKPFFVMLGTIEARKNHWMILHVWREIAEELGIDTPILVIIGQRGWESENAIDMLERCHVVRPYVMEKSFCSDEELAGYLAHAKALLFPTFAEGYGMPLIESITMGTPVIASDLDVFHEISGNIPEYLDPIDGIGWKSMIMEYMQPDSQARTAQIKRMDLFVPPCWDDHFTSVEQLLVSLG